MINIKNNKIGINEVIDCIDDEIESYMITMTNYTKLHNSHSQDWSDEDREFINRQEESVLVLMRLKNNFIKHH